MTDIKRILFCTPCYGGMVFEPHFRSCLELCRDLSTLGVDFDWLTGRNESLVHRGRMEMTASFLETTATHMMWLDADLDFTTDDVGKLWNLVESDQADVAVGVYAMKKSGEDWYAAWRDGVLVKDLDQFDGPIEVDYAGTGFMMIRREVIEKLAETSDSFVGKNGKKVPALYMTPIHEGVLESEDYYFCRRVREAGFRLIMDPSIRLGHWGLYRYGESRS